jgi:hypothetical protein
MNLNWHHPPNWVLPRITKGDGQLQAISFTGPPRRLNPDWRCHMLRPTAQRGFATSGLVIRVYLQFPLAEDSPKLGREVFVGRKRFAPLPGRCSRIGRNQPNQRLTRTRPFLAPPWSCGSRRFHPLKGLWPPCTCTLVPRVSRTGNVKNRRKNFISQIPLLWPSWEGMRIFLPEVNFPAAAFYNS